MFDVRLQSCFCTVEISLSALLSRLMTRFHCGLTAPLRKVNTQEGFD